MMLFFETLFASTYLMSWVH